MLSCRVILKKNARERRGFERATVTFGGHDQSTDARSVGLALGRRAIEGRVVAAGWPPLRGPEQTWSTPTTGRRRQNEEEHATALTRVISGTSSVGANWLNV